MKTFFKKDPTNLGRVINEVDPDNIWVLEEWIPIRKFDGTSCAIIGWELYKRYDAKSGRNVPEEFRKAHNKKWHADYRKLIKVSKTPNK